MQVISRKHMYVEYGILANGTKGCSLCGELAIKS